MSDILRRAAAAWLLCAAGLQAGPALAEIRETDDGGRELLLPAPAARVISLAPNVTELLYAAGAGGKLVGAVEYSDYPPAARQLARVGDATRVDLESLLALKPQLVVGWLSGNPASTLERLRDLGIPVYTLEPRVPTDVARHLRVLARLTGTAATGENAARAFEAGIADLAAEYRNAEPLSVFYQISEQPIYTVNGEHIISRVIELCGGRNVFADPRILAPRVSREAVLLADPQVIVSGLQVEEKDAFAAWRPWTRLRAVASGNLYRVNPDHLHRATPRLLDGARAVCEALAKARRKAAAVEKATGKKATGVGVSD